MSRLWSRITDTLFRERRNKRAKEIIKRYNLPLIRAICSRVNFTMSIGIDLMDINIIPDRIYHEFSKTVNNPDAMTDMIFASTLMSRVRRTLYEDPGCFPVIMNTFRKHSSLNDIVVLMEKEYYADTISISAINIFIVSFFLGLLIGVLLFFVLWPSSPVTVNCTKGGEEKLLLKLTSSFTDTDTDISNLTSCLLQYHHYHHNVTKLLEYYYKWCIANHNTTSVEESSISNNTNTTGLNAHQWCTMIETIYNEDTLNLSRNYTVEENTERTWCYENLKLLLNCFNT